MKLLLLTCSYLIICMKMSTSAPNHERVDDVDLNDSIDQCAAQIGLLIEETRRSFTMPIEAPGNCVMACVWDKIGLMDIDGKIIKEEMITSIHPTLELLPNITRVTEDDFYQCVDEANRFGDPCTVISEYFKCLIKDLFMHNT
uniref:Odorant-binding protein 11 n=1 Tax=Chouioia cunea TaxID=1570515 RepID=A0A6B9CJS5_9HYME|nr:odorant-binding protein 11 [Chouioia cunea]